MVRQQQVKVQQKQTSKTPPQQMFGGVPHIEYTARRKDSVIIVLCYPMH